MEKLPLQVSEALALINQTLEYAYPTLVIEGEIASFKINQGKYVFFDIKDDESTLTCFMMVFQLRMPLEDGMKVRIVTTPKLTAWGKFSLTVRDITPVGEGSLKRSYELLRKKLEQEGLFSDERKRQIPTMPQMIAVISSTQSAGYADFIRILNERWGGVKVQVAHVQVQGIGAADQMIRALRHFNEQEALPDEIVIIRGGGSADDLSVFNDELLVRAIAASRIPTVVGVGHETDESLADLVADVRAATPSHAAQLIVPEKQDILRSMFRGLLRAADSTEGAVTTMSTAINQKLNDAIETWTERLAQTSLQCANQRLLLDAFNPQRILENGYAIIRGDIRQGSIVEIEQKHRYITAEVQHVTKK